MESEDTLRKNDAATNKILQAIGDLRREMNERFTKTETEIEEIKRLQFSFDVRLDRGQAMAHDALNIGHDLKADVKILHAEVRAWGVGCNGFTTKSLERFFKTKEEEQSF